MEKFLKLMTFLISFFTLHILVFAGSLDCKKYLPTFCKETFETLENSGGIEFEEINNDNAVQVITECCPAHWIQPYIRFSDLEKKVKDISFEEEVAIQTEVIESIKRKENILEVPENPEETIYLANLKIFEQQLKEMLKKSLKGSMDLRRIDSTKILLARKLSDPYVAYATYGNVIVFNLNEIKEILATGEPYDFFAYTFFHEMGHVIFRHAFRKIFFSFSSVDRSNIMIFVRTPEKFPSTSVPSHYIKFIEDNNESVADYFAVRLMEENHLSLKGTLEFLGKSGNPDKYKEPDRFDRYNFLINYLKE